MARDINLYPIRHLKINYVCINYWKDMEWREKILVYFTKFSSHNKFPSKSFIPSLW